MLSRTVLVVDDEEDIQELVKLCLARDGYDILTTDTGEQALTMARSRHPGLVVLDLLLPGLSGLDVCKILKADPRTQRIPIILLSAKGQESDIVAALELGADDYITKPFNAKVLAARVRRALRRGREQELDRGAIHIHDLTIDPSRCEAVLNGCPLSQELIPGHTGPQPPSQIQRFFRSAGSTRFTCLSDSNTARSSTQL